MRIRTFFLLSMLFLLISCGDDSKTLTNTTYISTFARSGIVKNDINRIKKLRLFYDKSANPIIYSYDNDKIFSYLYQNEKWTSNSELDGINGVVDFARKDGILYILNNNDEKFNLYVKTSDNIFIIDLANKLEIFGKIYGSSIIVDENKIYISYIINESEVDFAYRSVTGGTWSKVVVNNSAETGSGFYTGSPFLLVKDENRIFISYYDAGFGIPIVSEKLGDTWETLSVYKGNNSWMDMGEHQVLFLDNHGELGVFYNEKIEGKLYYSNFITEVAKPEILYEDGYVGDYISGGLLGDMPFLLFYEGNRASLKIVYRISQNKWEIKYVRSMGISGYYVDAVARSSDIIGTVYLDELNDVMIFQEIPGWQLN